MKAENSILSLLHDTLLDNVKYDGNNLHLSFSFYLDDDKEQTAIVSSTNVSDINCVELLPGNKEQQINLERLIDSDCMESSIENNNLYFFLVNELQNKYIKLNYKSKTTTIDGKIDELKQFWDVSD